MKKYNRVKYLIKMLLKIVLFVLCINIVISNSLAGVKGTSGLDDEDLKGVCAHELKVNFCDEGLFTNQG